MDISKFLEQELGVSSPDDFNLSDELLVDIGDIALSSLPAEQLEEITEKRKNHIVNTVIPRLKTLETEGRFSSAPLHNFKKLIEAKKIPLAGDDIRGKPNLYIPLTYKEYIKLHDETSNKHKYNDRNDYKLFSADYEGWKEYLLQANLPSTAFLKAPIHAHISLKHFKKHAYIVGGSGSGKSELIKLLVYSQIRKEKVKQGAWKSGAVVIDPHGDLAKDIARFKECYGNERIVYLDAGIYQGKTFAIDPFKTPDQNETTIDTYAQNIAGAMEEIITDSSISAQMKTLLIPCISVLLRRPKSNLGDLQRFMIGEQNSDLVELGLNSPNLGQAEFFRDGFNNKNLEITKRGIYNRLQSLRNYSLFRQMLRPEATLDLEKELEKGKIVLFNLSKGKMGDDVSSAFGRFVVAQIKNIGFRRQNQPHNMRKSTFVYIDECQNYIGDSIKSGLTELRKYNIHLILANQIVGQDMSSQLAKITLTNTAIKFCGTGGVQNAAAMSKELGVKESDVIGIKQHHFYCKINTGKKTAPFSFKAPAYLANGNNAMTSQKWKEQIKRGWLGYISKEEKRTDPTAPAKVEPSITTTPDYVDKPKETGRRKPKFKL